MTNVQIHNNTLEGFSITCRAKTIPDMVHPITNGNGRCYSIYAEYFGISKLWYEAYFGRTEKKNEIGIVFYVSYKYLFEK